MASPSMESLERELKSVSDKIGMTSEALRALQRRADEDAFALKRARGKIDKAETSEAKEMAEAERKELEAKITAREASKLVVTLLGLKGEAEGGTVSLSCSSPIEDFELSSPVTISEIDPSVAILTVSVDVGGKKLVSASLDAQPLCSDEADAAKEEEIALVLEGSDASGFDNTDNADGSQGTDVTNDPAAPQKTFGTPVGFVSLKFEYERSGDENKKLLIKAFNELGEQRMKVISQMRAVANVATTERGAGGRPGAVKGGFLNAKKKEPTGLFAKGQELTQKWLPRFMMVKNYVLFFGVVGMMHWKGNELHVPIPVI